MNLRRGGHGASWPARCSCSLDATSWPRGGFHTEGITSFLKKAGRSYAVLTPLLENIPAGDSLDAFRRDQESLEKRLMGEQLTLEAALALQTTTKLDGAGGKGPVVRARFTQDLAKSSRRVGGDSGRAAVFPDDIKRSLALNGIIVDDKGKRPHFRSLKSRLYSRLYLFRSWLTALVRPYFPAPLLPVLLTGCTGMDVALGVAGVVAIVIVAFFAFRPRAKAPEKSPVAVQPKESPKTTPPPAPTIPPAPPAKPDYEPIDTYELAGHVAVTRISREGDIVTTLLVDDEKSPTSWTLHRRNVRTKEVQEDVIDGNRFEGITGVHLSPDGSQAVITFGQNGAKMQLYDVKEKKSVKASFIHTIPTPVLTLVYILNVPSRAQVNGLVPGFEDMARKYYRPKGAESAESELGLQKILMRFRHGFAGFRTYFVTHPAKIEMFNTMDLPNIYVTGLAADIHKIVEKLEGYLPVELSNDRVYPDEGSITRNDRVKGVLWTKEKGRIVTWSDGVARLWSIDGDSVESLGIPYLHVDGGDIVASPSGHYIARTSDFRNKSTRRAESWGRLWDFQGQTSTYSRLYDLKNKLDGTNLERLVGFVDDQTFAYVDPLTGHVYIDDLTHCYESLAEASGHRDVPPRGLAVDPENGFLVGYKDGEIFLIPMFFGNSKSRSYTILVLGGFARYLGFSRVLSIDSTGHSPVLAIIRYKNLLEHIGSQSEIVLWQMDKSKPFDFKYFLDQPPLSMAVSESGKLFLVAERNPPTADSERPSLGSVSPPVRIRVFQKVREFGKPEIPAGALGLVWKFLGVSNFQKIARWEGGALLAVGSLYLLGRGLLASADPAEALWSLFVKEVLPGGVLALAGLHVALGVLRADGSVSRRPATVLLSTLYASTSLLGLPLIFLGYFTGGFMGIGLAVLGAAVSTEIHAFLNPKPLAVLSDRIAKAEVDPGETIRPSPFPWSTGVSNAPPAPISPAEQARPRRNGFAAFSLARSWGRPGTG